MRGSATPPPTIPDPSCAVIGCIPCSDGLQACPCSSACRRPVAGLSPANVHDAPFARLLLELALRLFAVPPRVIRLDAAYWGLNLIAWIHTVMGATAVIPWNPKRQKRRDGLPPTWTAEELGKRASIERFFGRVLVFFRLQRPPVSGWAVVETRVALTYAAVWVIALAAWQAGRPELIRSPRLVLAHVWEGVEL
jgi:transposase